MDREGWLGARHMEMGKVNKRAIEPGWTIRVEKLHRGCRLPEIVKFNVDTLGCRLHKWNMRCCSLSLHLASHWQ